MKLARYLVLAMFICGSAIGGIAFAGDETALKTMAGIMMHLNHYPSSEEKQTLHDISTNSENSEHIRTIAQAMFNLQHSAAAADKPKLKAVITDMNAPQEVRDLASIVLNINHHPSMADKKRLGTMM
jgi:NADPH-dependent ferric siderophore reductase